jgi:uroporphyrinogen-III decarboxylase
MTNRERLLAIMSGHPPDRIPWIPRLAIWYQAHKRRGTLPEKYRDWSLREIERDLGMGTPARDGKIFRTELHGVEVRTVQQGADTLTEYITPVGAVSTRQRRSEFLEYGGIDTQTDVAHMIKGPDDYPVVEYIIQHTHVIPTYDAYLAYEREIGEDGVPLVGIGPDPMYHILQDLIGYSQAFFHLHDYPDRVHHLLAVLTEHAEAVQEVVLASPAKLILHGEHFSSQFTPPYLFETYMLPYFQAFADKLHARNKVLACHADADTSRLLPLIKEAGFDMAECFVTAPMVPVTLAEARQAFGDDVIIWGGIPSVILGEPISDWEFRAYICDLFRTIAPGDAFILGVADNVMAEAKLERLEWVSALVAEFGNYPLDRDSLPEEIAAP